MFRIFLFFSVIVSTVFSDELEYKLPLPSLEGGPDTIVNGCVNAITGEFIDSVTHHTIPGSEPLIYESIYSNSMGWVDNHRIEASFYKKGQRRSYQHQCYFSHPGTASAHLSSTNQSSSETFRVNMSLKENKGVTNIARILASGQTNHKNLQLTLHKHWDDSVSLRSGNATNYKLKKIEKDKFSAAYLVDSISKPNGYRFRYATRKIQGPDEFRHTAINGYAPSQTRPVSHLTLAYDFKANIHDKHTIKTSDGRTVTKTYQPHVTKKKIVRGKRGGAVRRVPEKVTTWNLQHIKQSHGPDIKFSYWFNPDGAAFLQEKSLPDFRKLKVQYFGQNENIGLLRGQKLGKNDARLHRVYTICEPIGTTSEMHASSRFEYTVNPSGSGITKVFDAYHHQTKYLYDDQKRLTKKIEALEHSPFKPFRSSIFTWSDRGSKKGNLVQQKLVDQEGKCTFSRSYDYDCRGNVTRETIIGNFIGNGDEHQTIEKTCTYTQDGMNLLLSETCLGKTTVYTYKPRTNLILSKIVSTKDGICSREFYEYDEDSIQTKKNSDDGFCPDRNDMNGVTKRMVTTTIPKKSGSGFGLPEVIIQSYFDPDLDHEVQLKKSIFEYSPEGWLTRQDLYDANDVHCGTSTWKYNSYGLVIEEINPMGHVITRDYDRNGNMIREEGPRPGHIKEIGYDFSNRPINITETDSTGFSATSSAGYDLLGRLIVEIDEFGHETRHHYDSLGREVRTTFSKVATFSDKFENPEKCQEYDICNNPIQVIDAEGRSTTSQFTAYQKPYHVVFADGSEEICIYNLDGTLKSQTARNGSITHFQYDSLGREIYKEICTSGGITLQTHQKYYEGANLKGEIDSKGMLTEYEYDHAGRMTAIKCGNRIKTFEYDSLGREHIVKHWINDTDYNATVKIYDLLDRVIEERTEDHTGKIQILTRYDYDEMDNPTCTSQIIQSQLSETKIEYDCRKRPTKIINPEEDITVFKYETTRLNCQNVLQKITIDSKGIQTIETHDALNRVVKIEKKDSFGELLFKQEMIYDKIGNRVHTETTVITPGEDERVVLTEWEYNTENQVICLTEAARSKDQRITRYEYTSFGEKERVIKSNGTEIHYAYNALGLVEKLWSIGSDHPVLYEYQYDNCNNLIRVMDKIHHLATERKFNEYDELIQEECGNGLTMTYEKDRLGRNVSLIYPNGKRATYSYSGVVLEQVAWKTYSHVYDQFDLSGRLEKATLIGSAGQCLYEYDIQGREVVREYSLWRQQAEYDSTGNLVRRQIKDSWGSEDCSYRYDKLNQIIEETGLSEHTYIHDSVNNRVDYDGNPLTINNLHQVISYDGTSYLYDASGNLICDGETTYEYDALDRCVRVIRNNEEFHYIYDSFNRRLTKEKYVLEQIADHVNYLYQGELEVGSIGSRHEEYRILGLGMGAEIGAAVIIEINDQTFAPIHDHLGNLVSLVDADTGAVAASYRYTAFGQVETHKGIHSPWTFASKRHDEETGWIYFGRRYYQPELGRWTTCDPKGYSEGYNLYAYVLNNPLMLFDLFGLAVKEYHEALSINKWEAEENLLAKGSLAYTLFYPGFLDFPQEKGTRQSRVSYLSKFENIFPHENSHPFDLNFAENQSLGVGVINGMATDQQSSVEMARNVADKMGGENVRGVYNATHSAAIDLSVECVINFLHVATKPVELLHQIWYDFFDQAGNNAPFVQICHSQGAIHVRNALICFPEELRQRIHVIAVAPGAYIDEHLCGSIVHLVSNWDPVPRIDFIGRWRNRHTTINLTPAEGATWFDHWFDSPTYQEALIRALNTLNNNLGGLWDSI